MYIRTKDGVYEVTVKQYNVLSGNLTEEEKEDYKNITSLGIGDIEKGTYKSIIFEDILFQSDNLEACCDEFVMTHYFPETNYTKREVLKEDKDLMIKAVRLKKQHNKDKDLKNEFNIYGCIWVEIKLPNNKLVFRLEPVVIMNEEGVLCLI